MDFLAELNSQGMTILLITHDMHLMLEYTTRAIVMDKGRIIADGPPSVILTDSEITRQANLKETSLLVLAKRVGIIEPKEFVEHFIAYDREVRRQWQ